MSPPLPLPSKAAIRALRSIALGSSCAIGVIVEERRQRISTLKTAVANKERLQSSRQYRRNPLEQIEQLLDDATPAGPSLQRHEIEASELRKQLNAETRGTENAILEDIESQVALQEDTSQKNVPMLQPSSSQSTPPRLAASRQPPSFATSQLPTPLAVQLKSNSLPSRTIEFSQPELSVAVQKSQNALMVSIETLLENADQDSLGRAVKLLVSSSTSIASSPRRESWLSLSLRVSRKCQESDRWEDAGQILTTLLSLGLGPLSLVEYFAYNPLSIIEFYLRRPNPDTPCSTENVTLAANLYLAFVKETTEGSNRHMERIGRLLVLEALSSQLFILARHVYWRLLSWATTPVDCASFAIHTFFRNGDHKTVLRIFLLHFSRMKCKIEYFEPTIDRVMKSVEALQGLKAESILTAFAQMECPGDGKVRSRWIMQLLRAHWSRHGNLYETKQLFDKAVSLGLLDKINHPEAVYRSLIEIAVKAGDANMAHSYADKVIHDYPYMKDEIALKLAVLKAQAGDWDGVLATFKQVQRSELARPIAYDDAFTLVLKVFAESHSANKTEDFVMVFVRDMGVEFHRHIVTIVAKKYGQAHDMDGFMAWLSLCARKGFALDPGFCNSVLYNCRAKWKVAFPELRKIYAKFKALNPDFADEVTPRIMSQAAQHAGIGLVHLRPGKIITVNKTAYIGRSTNKREIYEAMNQALMDDRPRAAVHIYKRAMQFGMPFSSHCLRLAVLASLRTKSAGSGPALSMIRDAHAQGHDVGLAISTFIKRQIDAFHGSPEDVITHMRNVISRFESSQIAIAPAVLTHVAAICVKIGQHEKAISLCHLARDRSGSSHLCFSAQSFTALATAYAHLFDIRGMTSLINSMCESQFSADKALLAHLESIRRLVNKRDESNAKTALLDVIERGIQYMTRTRAAARTQGKLISRETLEIVGRALLDLEAKTKPVIPSEGLIRGIVVGSEVSERLYT
ncbi:hypothetical protein F5Y12DRAFT_747438 [Xylaria sp. FL1777]|nr:hypothetical protein F5Y12DRAFT_747438 [Xylaria sp. FL1777]